MQAGKRKIEAGFEYDYLFPKADGTDTTIKRNANLDDTLEFLPQAIHQTKEQTKKFAEFIRDKNTYETCKNIWQFLFRHVQYEKDKKGFEQIRGPRRTWHDRNWQGEPNKGVDCDDFSVFVSSTLLNLNIPHLLRVCMYNKQEGYQHIYVVAFDEQGKEIIIDCVVDRFNYQVPYLKKIDKPMELQFLNGIPEKNTNRQTVNNSVDAEDLLNGEDIGDLGKIKLNLKKPAILKKVGTGIKVATKKVGATIKTTAQKAGTGIKKAAVKTGAAIKKGVHAVNKVNPAAVLLRAGVLASMKLNVMNVAGNLRYTYLSKTDAQQKGFDMGKFDRLIGVRQRLEKIFYGAGGQADNLKKAILTGNGNKNKEVPLSGLGIVTKGNFTENDSLQQILGTETYQTEFEGVEGLGEVGELGVVTATALAAASGAMAALAALIKNIGNLKRNNNTKDNNNTDNQEASDSGVKPEEQSSSDSSVPTDNSLIRTTPSNEAQSSSANYADTPSFARQENDGKVGVDKNPSDLVSQKDSINHETQNSTTNANGESMLSRFTNWIKANKSIAIGVGVIASAAIAYGVYNTLNKKKASATAPLSGASTSIGKGKRKRKRKHNNKKSNAKIKVQPLR